MKEIRFTAYFSGMSGTFFSETILISKPYGHYEKKITFEDEQLEHLRISDVLGMIKDAAEQDHNALGDWGGKNLGVDTIYIKTEQAMLGLQEDKALSEVFLFFDSEVLELSYFVVAGGASIHCNGYQFIVHPDERIHEHTPHVHVKKDDVVVRYYLDSLKRFPQDKASREFDRDEKKRIMPCLKKNQDTFYKYWNQYMHGYVPPTEDENGRQYYSES